MRLPRFGLVWTLLAAAAAVAAAPPAGVTPSPTPAPAAAGALQSNPADAKALFAKVVESLGGKERISKIHDVRTRGQIAAKTPQGEMTMQMETTMVFPDRLFQAIDAPFGRFSMVATPGGAFIVGNEGVQDLAPAIGNELLRQVQRTAFFLAQRTEDPQLVVREAGEEKIGDVSTKILDVTLGEAAVRWFVDPATGRILRSSHESAGLNGTSVRVVSDYSDFRAAEGFLLPHRLEVVTQGSPDQTLVLEEIKINSGVDAKIFEKPAAKPNATAKPAPAEKPTPTAKPKPS
ncbi:MAG: hypothetical protein ABI968_08815 [Acidobacteriota bacterium]